jgi:hypothetical protein
MNELRIPITGIKTLGLHCAIVFAIYQYKSSWIDNNQKKGGWFEFLYSEQTELTGMKECALRKYRNILIDKGILEKKTTRTLPRRTLYRFNLYKMIEYGY